MHELGRLFRSGGESNDASQRSAPSQVTTRTSGLLQTGLFLLALYAAIVVPFGRGIAPVLFGLRTGMGRIIEVADWTNAWLTQALAWGGLLLFASLFSALLRASHVNNLQRLLVLPAAGISAVLVAFACTSTLDPRVNLTLSWSTSALLVAGGSQALRSPRMRALGLALVCFGIAAAFDALARSLAFETNRALLPSRIGIVRVWITVAFSFALIGIAIGTAWWIRPADPSATESEESPSRKLRLIAPAFALSAAFGALLLARSGDAPGAPTVATLASLALREMARQPAPFVPEPVRDLVLSYVHAFALFVLFRRWEERWVGPVLSLALVSLGSTDIPCASLLSLTAGLALLLLAGSAKSAFGQLVRD